MNMQAILNKDYRRMVLWFLMMDNDYCLSKTLLMSCFSTYGKDITSDQLGNTINWLNEQGFVSKEIVAQVTYARLTDRGLDIAQGKCRAVGVRDLMPSEVAEIKAFKGY